MNIKEKVKKTWRDTGVPDESGKRVDTETRLKAIGSKVRGWRNYHRNCDLGKHRLWFIRQWLWKKLRKDKARTKKKEIEKELRKKKAGTLSRLKVSEIESQRENKSHQQSTTNTKVKGAAKRILTNAQIEIAFPKVEWKVNSHVMVKGAASPFDGNLTSWVNRKSKLYADSPTGSAITRQKMRCSHCNLPFMPDDTVELHHKDGDDTNWKPSNCVALHRECHQHQEIYKVRVKEGKAEAKAKAKPKVKSVKSSLTAMKPGSRVSVDTARF